MITRDLFNENFDSEYDDEAGMAKTNLVTIARAAEGLLDTIDDQENLPEWVQEKIAKVQGMMVAAWDYLESQEAQGIDPRQGVAEEKVRLDPKCWTGKKIGNPKTKMKGGVRVNNCVPAESVEESHTEVKDKEGKVVSWKDDTEWHKSEKNKQGQPKDPRGTVTHLSDIARRKTEKQSQGVAEGSEHFDGIEISMEKEDDEITVKAMMAGGRELGHVLFVIDGDYLMPQDLEVDERYHGQGIAATMYNYVKSKGYKIRRSGQQTDAGAGFWDKHKPGKNVWEQGMTEGEKIGNMDAGDFDAAMSRLKKLAGAGPMKTVYDPATRRYKNVPTAVQPAQQPRKK